MINIPKTPGPKGSLLANFSVTMGTLAVNTGLLTAGPVMTRGGKILSLSAQAAWRSGTPTDGPFSVWLVENGLDLTTFEAYLEQAGPVQPNDISAVEVASRGKLVRYLGLLTPSGDGSIAGFDIRNRSMSGLGWNEENAGFSLVVYNLGNAVDTGSIVRVFLQCFVEWTPGG